MFDSPAMRETIRRFLRAQMAYRGFEYKDLSAALEALGVTQTESNLRSKVNNGSLGAQLFMYILMALEVEALDMARIRHVLADVEASMPPDDQN